MYTKATSPAHAEASAQGLSNWRLQAGKIVNGMKRYPRMHKLFFRQQDFSTIGPSIDILLPNHHHPIALKRNPAFFWPSRQ